MSQNKVRDLQMQLTGKNVLLIMPFFYDYEIEIKHCFEKYGAQVFMLQDVVRNVNLLYKILCTLYAPMKNILAERYYRNAIQKMNADIDVVMLIRGESISPAMMQLLKEKYPNAFFVMYQWDSVANHTAACSLVPYFHSVLTFDLEDAEQYQWVYRPSFYTPCDVAQVHKEYDLAFICTLHSQRLSILKQLRKIAKERQLTLFEYMRSSRWQVFRQRYCYRNPAFTDMQGVSLQYKALPLETVKEIYQKSIAVVDYGHPQQNGLTLRPIECLAYQCKLLTNNASIKNCDFYNPHNIFVYQNDQLKIPEDFLTTPYEPVEQTICERYTIDHWLGDILSAWKLAQ